MPRTGEHAEHDIAFHRETAASYDRETTREFAIYHTHALHPFLDRLYRPGMTAVDLGAGTGVVTLALAGRGFQVVAIDQSPDMLAIAQRKAEQAGLDDRIEFVEADLAGADAPRADVVCAQGVLHHLADPEEGVAAIARSLKPGGHFYVAEPCVDLAPPGKLIAAAFPVLFAARRVLLRRAANIAPPSVEKPLSAASLFACLRAHDLDYDAEFLTHIPRAHLWMSDRLRLRLTLAVSRPWRRRRGDQLIVRGRARG